MDRKTTVSESVRTRPTIYDVAKKAAVSAGTVSRVLNASGAVNKHTRHHVLQMARSMGCRPRVGVRRKQIAMITEPPPRTIMGGYVSSLTQYLVWALSRLEMALVFVTEDNLDVLSHRLMDGVLAVAWRPETFEALLKLEGTPVVLINHGDKTDRFPVVMSDHREGGRMVGDYLLDRGHRKLAMITKAPDWGALARVEGMRAAMEARGVPVDDRQFAFCDDGRLMYAHLKRIVDDGAEAIWVCGEDMLAVEALYILQNVLGVRVPEELSVVGNENPGISLYLRPSLTTLAQPLQGLAEESVKLLAKLIEEPKVQTGRVISLPNSLIERDSVAIRKGESQ